MQQAFRDMIFVDTTDGGVAKGRLRVPWSAAFALARMVHAVGVEL